MKAVTLNKFLEADLLKLASGVDNVVVATYNNLDDYRNGGELSDKDKKITILCGGGAYAGVNTMMGNFPNENAPATKTAGAKKVSDSLTRVGKDSLVILYAGVSRFGEMTKLAYNLAERDVKVALVSCGCNDNIFSNLQSNKNITAVIPSHGGCNGGRGDLSEIVATLLK